MIIFHFPDGSAVSTENVTLALKWSRIYCRYNSARVEASEDLIGEITNACDGIRPLIWKETVLVPPTEDAPLQVDPPKPKSTRKAR